MPFTTAMEISNIIFRVQYLKLCSNYGNTGEFLWRAVLYLQRHCKPNQNKQGNRVMRPKRHYLWTSSKHVIIDTQTIYRGVYILDITEFIKWVAQHNKKLNFHSKPLYFHRVFELCHFYILSDWEHGCTGGRDSSREEKAKEKKEAEK